MFVPGVRGPFSPPGLRLRDRKQSASLHPCLLTPESGQVLEQRGVSSASTGQASWGCWNKSPQHGGAKNNRNVFSHSSEGHLSEMGVSGAVTPPRPPRSVCSCLLQFQWPRAFQGGLWLPPSGLCPPAPCQDLTRFHFFAMFPSSVSH